MNLPIHRGKKTPHLTAILTIAQCFACLSLCVAKGFPCAGLWPAFHPSCHGSGFPQPFTQAAVRGFQSPSAVVFLFLFPCCYSHGLAPANPDIAVKAGFQGNQSPQATRGESPLLPLLSYHAVLVFSLHEIIQQYVCTKLNNHSPCSLCPQSVLQSPLTAPQAGATKGEFEQVLLKIMWFLQKKCYWKRGPCCTGDSACPPSLLCFCSHLSTKVACTFKVNVCHQLETLLINLHMVYLEYFLPYHIQN